MNSVLECRDLVKTFNDGNRELRILRGVNLDVREGQILAISGASGAGKSTLLQIMGSLDRPTSGEVLVHGQSLSRMGRRAINRMRNEQIGFVFQFYHLLPEFTALENVMIPALCKGARRAACFDRAKELLVKVGLEDRMTHKPGKLSGGEQQRVAIARAMYMRPSVILADEPTGNLDEGTGVGITQLLWDLNASEGATIVLVTHDDTLARKAHRWVMLHDGLAQERALSEAS